MTSPDLALLHIDARIATLTLNRPDAHNALSIQLLAAAAARIAELEAIYAGPAAASAPTVIVLTGAGRSFCAGMDLEQVIVETQADHARPRALLHALADLTIRLRALPAVVVAKVGGPAIGGGCGLTCVADISITHAANKLGFPEVDMGICPAVVAPWLVRKIGPGRARLILLSGGLMTGRQAHDLGLVDHCVESPDELDAACTKITQRLAAAGPNALAATKGLLNDLDRSLEADLVRRGADLSARVLCEPPAQEALRARRKK